MNTLVYKIWLPNEASKAVKLHENAVISDAHNAILNRLDKRTSREDFYIYEILGERAILLNVDQEISNYQNSTLLLKRLFIPRFIMEETRQEHSFLAFQLTENVLRFPFIFQNAAKICAIAFRHYIGEKLIHQTAQQYFEVEFSETLFNEIIRNIPPYDAENADQLILQEISKNNHGFAHFFIAGIVEENEVKVREKCILVLQEEGFYVLGEKGRQIGGISWFQVKAYGGDGHHFCVLTSNDLLWFACLETMEILVQIEGWISRRSASIIM